MAFTDWTTEIDENVEEVVEETVEEVVEEQEAPTM